MSHVIKFIRFWDQVELDESEQQQMDESAVDPANSSLIGFPFIALIPSFAKDPEIDDRKEGKAGIREYEEIGD